MTDYQEVHVSTRVRRSVQLVLVGLMVVTVSGCAEKPSPAGAGNEPTPPVATVSSPASAATAASPSSSPLKAAVPSAIDGRWNGTYSSTSSPGSDGTFEVTYRTSASGQLSGTIAIHSTPCVSTGTVNGRVQGTTITFGAVHGAQSIAFTGSVSGNEMSGTYDAPDCGHGKGTWTASRA